MKGRFDPALAEGLYFEEADVVANRNGLMSARQQAQFANGAVQGRRHGRTTVKILVVAGVVTVAFVVFAAKQGGQDVGDVALPLGVVVAAIMVVTVVARRANRRLADRFEQGAPVQVAEGPISVDEHPSSVTDGSRGSTGWEIEVEGVKFRLLDDQAALFVPGDAYRLYYCDFGMARLTLLAAERAV